MFKISSRNSLNLMIKKSILILYLAIITTLSIIPSSDMSSIKLFKHSDKVAHICMYAGLSFLLLWLWNKQTNKSKYLTILLIIFGWGLLMEIIQGTSHLGRSFDMLDIIANILGFLPGLLVWEIIIKKFGEKIDSSKLS